MAFLYTTGQKEGGETGTIASAVGTPEQLSRDRGALTAILHLNLIKQVMKELPNLENDS